MFAIIWNTETVGNQWWVGVVSVDARGFTAAAIAWIIFVSLSS